MNFIKARSQYDNIDIRFNIVMNFSDMTNCSVILYFDNQSSKYNK